MKAALAPIAAGAALLVAAAAGAFPDGAPWDAHGGEGCAECHFAGEVIGESPAVEFSGLPDRPTAGARYRLTLGLADPEAVRSGFLLAILAEGGAAGGLVPCTEGVEIHGAAARSTGAAPPWRLVWQAPDPLPPALRFIVWANAADGDGSPFGDRIHHRIFVRPTKP